MNESKFLPIIVIDDSGEISSEWSDSYESTITEWGEDVPNGGGEHSKVLDERLAKIRKLIADFYATGNPWDTTDVAQELVDLISPFFV